MKGNWYKKITRNSIIYFDSCRDYRKSIFLAGSGRSGTTWISNIINYNNEYRYLFEPFHSKRVSLCKNFNYRQYLRPENREQHYLEPATRILSGKIRNLWVDSQNRKFIAQKRLIKEIRANLFLKWLKTRFPEMPMILLLRHPCAVACSKIKLKWEIHLDEYLIQEELMGDYLSPFTSLITKSDDIFADHIIQWCIENYVPLQQFKKGEILLLFYENFCVTPHEEIKKLYRFLNKEYDSSVFNMLKKPSSRAREGSAVLTGGDLINSWKKSITTQQLQTARLILNEFGLDSIYLDDSTPDPAVINHLLPE